MKTESEPNTEPEAGDGGEMESGVNWEDTMARGFAIMEAARRRQS